MFNQHTFDVKVNITVEMICNRGGYYDHAEEIEAMKNEKCHLDFVVAVWDGLNLKIAEMVRNKSEKHATIVAICVAAQVQESALKNYLYQLDKNWDNDPSELKISVKRGEKLRAVGDELLQILRNMSYLEKYRKQVEDIIAIKPMSPYPQEQHSSDSIRKMGK